MDYMLEALRYGFIVRDILIVLFLVIVFISLFYLVTQIYILYFNHNKLPEMKKKLIHMQKYDCIKETFKSYNLNFKQGLIEVEEKENRG